MPERPTRRDSTRGRVPFVWVEDVDTGHRYDVPETAVRPGMTVVDNYPKNYTANARPTKYRVDLVVNPQPEPVVDEPSGDAVVARTVSAKKKEAGS